MKNVVKKSNFDQCALAIEYEVASFKFRILLHHPRFPIRMTDEILTQMRIRSLHTEKLLMKSIGWFSNDFSTLKQKKLYTN